MVEGHCRLCCAHGELKLSHFIPKFVGKWVKETSATGYVRLTNNINKRAQDLAKDYWLCGVCEQLFSGWEREFANRVFYPFVKDETDTANYGEWLAKFCASLSWRTLSYIRSLNPRPENEINEKEIAMMDGLASFILGESNNLGIYEQHLYPLDPIDSTNADIPMNINRYFLRNMHMDVLSGNGDVMVYTKLPKFIILGLAGHGESGKLRSSRVSIGGGKIFPRKYNWPTGFAEYMFGKVKEVSTLHEAISPSQRDMIDKSVRNNPERFAASGTYAAFRHDLDMFGPAAFAPNDAEDSDAQVD